MHFVRPPPPPPKKNASTIIFNFSWERACSQEKLKSIVYAKFFFLGGGGGQTKCIMGDVEVVNSWDKNED